MIRLRVPVSPACPRNRSKRAHRVRRCPLWFLHELTYGIEQLMRLTCAVADGRVGIGNPWFGGGTAAKLYGIAPGTQNCGCTWGTGREG